MKRSFGAALMLATLLASAAVGGIGVTRAADATIAPAAPYTVGGHSRSTATLKGRPAMLWLLSTWCGSCAAGLQAMAKNATQIQKSGLRVVILRNYQDGGYPGPTIDKFVSEVAPTILRDTKWTLGNASAALERAYNSRHYADIYFLIDATGRIQQIGGAPAATMAKILRFAHNDT